MGTDDLCAAWLDAKREEAEAIERRRSIEDRMVSLLGVSDAHDGTESFELDGGYKVKVTCRINRRVDGDKVQEIARENGLTDHLPNLFRWKPEINKKVWDATSENITKTLASAITAKPGRPTISVEKE